MTSSDAQHQKVHVAVGNNLQEGLATLEWAIKRWSSHPISIVIIHAKSSISKEIVNTPFGKLPATAVNEEKLQELRKCEDEKIDRMLSKYMTFCGKLLFAKEENQQEEQIEDQERLKQKPYLKGWLGKVLASGRTTAYQYESSSLPPSNNCSELSESKNQWDMYSPEIEEYFQQLLEEKNEAKSPIEPDILNSVSEDKLEAISKQILEAKRMIQLKKEQAKADLGENIDVKALGILLLQLLCGRNWAGVDQEELVMIGKQPIYDALDDSAGEWPLDLVEEISEVAMKCILVDSVTVLSSAVKVLSLVKNKADELLQSEKPDRRREFERGQLFGEDDESSVPDIFVCPIFQEMMENPHIAADGYSYEFDAIEEWLQTGHETSPLTKTRLEHKHVTPNHALRAFIQEWRSRNSHLCS